MAIDTENKRRSISGYSGLAIAPVPDGAFSLADRAHMVWLYALDAIGAAVDPAQALSGRVSAMPQLAGQIQVSPRLTGMLTAYPRFSGRITVEPDLS